MKKYIKFSSIFCFILILVMIFNFSILSYSQVKTLTKLELSEGEKIYNIYTDSLQTSYAIIIQKTTEGLISTIAEYYILTPDSKLGPFESVFDVAFFDSGKQILISVKKEGKFFVYKNNEVSGPFDNIGRFSVIYSTNFYTYWVKENNVLFVMTPDNKLGPYSKVSFLTADQKSKNIAWTAQKSSEQTELFMNANSIAKADKIVIFGFYTDKRTFCYATGTSAGYYLYIGSKVYGPYENIGLDLAVKNEDLAIFFAKISGSWYLIAGKEKVGPFDSTGFVAISPDGGKIAYAGFNQEGWSIYLGSKLFKKISSPKLLFLDFIKDDQENYQITYLSGEFLDVGLKLSLYIGLEDDPYFEYSINTDSPYIGELNIAYYGVDFIVEQQGSISFLFFEDEKFGIGIYSIKGKSLALFGLGDDYNNTYILDIAADVVFFVMNGNFFVGVPLSNSENYSNFKTTGRIVYGHDGQKIGVVFFDPNTNSVCYVDIDNVKSTFEAIFML